MRLDINQKKISLRNKFSVVKDGHVVLEAASKIFRLLAETELFQPGSEIPLGRIKRQLALFNAKYEIEMKNQPKAYFNTVSWWKNHHQCKCGNSTYDVYGHRGRKYSIFMNGKQVAYFDKEAVTFFEGDNYKLIANDDSELFLLVCIVLVVDNYRSNKKNNDAINFDIGHIFQARKFDKQWLPKVNQPIAEEV